MNHLIIYKTHPQVVNIRGDVAYDANGQVVEIDQSAYDAEIARLEAEQVATEYKRLRAPEYPPIGDQLDEIYHDIDAWRARVAQVKASNPK